MAVYRVKVAIGLDIFGMWKLIKVPI